MADFPDTPEDFRGLIRLYSTISLPPRLKSDIGVVRGDQNEHFGPHRLSTVWRTIKSRLLKLECQQAYGSQRQARHRRRRPLDEQVGYNVIAALCGTRRRLSRLGPSTLMPNPVTTHTEE